MVDNKILTGEDSSEAMLEQIFGYMNSLVLAKGFENILQVLTNLGRCVAGADRASFWYADRKMNQYWTLAATGTDRITVDKGTGIVGACIENGETIIIDNPYEDHRFNSDIDKKTGYVTKSILCMPVRNSRGVIIGAYQVINKISAKGVFDDRDVFRLSLAAVYCGSLLETHMLEEESRKDALTGLLNRRGFYDDVQNLLDNAEDDFKTALIMCDIDFFKKVNDTYGHNAGDEVLARISKILRSKVDPEDVVCRWGGEEFIILLQKCDLKKAIEVAERIRSFVEQTVIVYEEFEIKVTMSFGVASFERAINLEDNVKIADERLYTAKQSGRNRVVSQ